MELLVFVLGIIVGIVLSQVKVATKEVVTETVVETVVEEATVVANTVVEEVIDEVEVKALLTDLLGDLDELDTYNQEFDNAMLEECERRVEEGTASFLEERWVKELKGEIEFTGIREAMWATLFEMSLEQVDKMVLNKQIIKGALV